MNFTTSYTSRMAIPQFVFLHGLGLSRYFWQPLMAALGETAHCIALDLPGFGDRAEETPLTIEETIDWLELQIDQTVDREWVLVGHSMSGKFAAIIAARGECGLSRLPPPAGLVLIAASPPTPEPMDDAKRLEMKSWWFDGRISWSNASVFVDANIAGDLAEANRSIALQAVIGSNGHAWISWLDRGSREDWSDSVGVLVTPALIVAGAEDGALGIEAQTRCTAPHFKHAQIETVEDAAHFIPIEQPEALAALMTAYWQRISLQSPHSLSPSFARLLASDRVSARTRQVLLGRMPAPTKSAELFTPPQRQLLEALIDRLLPQQNEPIDLASRCIAELAEGTGDGWRLAELPSDIKAWTSALESITALHPDFLDLPSTEKDRCIDKLIRGETASVAMGNQLDAEQLKLWMGELRRALVRQWVSHPCTMAAIGYDGFAVGGDGLRKTGYLLTAANQREDWQLSTPVVGNEVAR